MTATAATQRLESARFQRPVRSARITNEHLAGLGGVRLGAGLLVVGALIAGGQFIRFLFRLPYYPSPEPAILAWVLLLSAFIAGVVWVSLRGGLLTTAMLITLSIPAGAAVWIDLSSTTGLLPLGVIPSATLALGGLLMPLAALRRPLSLIVCIGLLAFTLAVWTALQMDDVGLWAITPWVLVFWGIYPSVLAILIVVLFRRMVRAHVDLALIQSATIMPPRSLSMIESERLTELDKAAEDLLADIGAGSAIDAAAAQRAGALASELRLALIEGRRESWLSNAIRESEFLRGAIELDDPAGAVADCDARSRDALLGALWMLATEHRPGTAPISVEIRSLPNGRTLEIRIQAQNIPRHRISPTLWSTLDLIGPRSSKVRRGSLEIGLFCSMRSTL